MEKKSGTTETENNTLKEKDQNHSNETLRLHFSSAKEVSHRWIMPSSRWNRLDK